MIRFAQQLPVGQLLAHRAAHQQHAAERQQRGQRQRDRDEQLLGLARRASERRGEVSLQAREAAVEGVEVGEQRRERLRRIAALDVRVDAHAELLELLDQPIALDPGGHRLFHELDVAEVAVEPDEAGDVVGRVLAGQEAGMHDRQIGTRLVELEAGLAVAERHRERLGEAAVVGGRPLSSVRAQVRHRVGARLGPQAFPAHVGPHRRQHAEAPDAQRRAASGWPAPAVRSRRGRSSGRIAR